MKIDTSKKSKGLGDSISKLTNTLKINKVVDAIAKLAGLEGCGCDERKDFLNELFPYESTTREFLALKDFDSYNKIYKKGFTYKITNQDEIYQSIIELVRDGNFKEV